MGWKWRWRFECAGGAGRGWLEVTSWHDLRRRAAQPLAQCAQLLLKTNGKPVLVKLTADGENVLQGSAAFTASPELQATLAVTFADNSSAQMNFQPLKPKPAAEPHQQHDHDKTHDEQHEHNEPHKHEDAHSHH